MRLNELLNIHKRKNKVIESGNKKNTWATSNFMLMFLENSIKSYTRQPKFSDDDP